MQGTWVQSLVGDLRSHMPQGNEACLLQKLSLLAATREKSVIPQAETKTRCSQINKYILKGEEMILLKCRAEKR